MSLKQISIFAAIIGFQLFAPKAKANALSGIWRTGCLQGISKQQGFTESRSQTTESFFQDKNCSLPAFQFVTNGEIQFPEQNSEFINFTYASVELTVYTQEVVADFNSRNVCGFSDWQTAQKKIITGLKCALFNAKKETQIAKVNDKKFGIYRLEQDKLYFGQLTREMDGSSPEKRPLKLNPEVYFKSFEPNF